MTYYNEIDPYAAQWIRNLASAGHISAGTVDERSITDVRATDLVGATRAHFFAGIGVWDYALRLAGWPDDRPVWTGSCPCQPFSVAGRGGGFDDERHLWPEFFRLIRECRPDVVFGEQVSSADGRTWLDTVSADLEGAGYAVGAIVANSASVGAPHGRHRIYFAAKLVAHSTLDRRHEVDPINGRSRSGSRAQGLDERSADGGAGLLGDSDIARREGRTDRAARPRHEGTAAERAGPAGGVGDTEGERCERSAGDGRQTWGGGELPGARWTVPNPWANPDWIACRDGKARPVEPVSAKMVARSAGGMGYVCSGASAPQVQDHEVDHAADEEADSVPCLRGMRNEDGAPPVPVRAGAGDELPQADLLLPSVHGAGNDGRSEVAERWSGVPDFVTDGGVDVREVRALRDFNAATRSSYRRGLSEQRAVEPDDVVRLLPSSLALAEARADHACAHFLRLLCAAVCEAGSVRYSPDAVPSVWERLGEEAKDRIRVGIDVRQWVIDVPTPLAPRTSGRVDRLRPGFDGSTSYPAKGPLKGFGNAVTAQVAATFIRAFMESE